MRMVTGGLFLIILTLLECIVVFGIILLLMLLLLRHYWIQLGHGLTVNVMVQTVLLLQLLVHNKQVINLKSLA